MTIFQVHIEQEPDSGEEILCSPKTSRLTLGHLASYSKGTEGLSRD